ncbi:MAG TPA: glycosyltransferase family A protein [Solirubrobacteraceae bacterium]|nr:glycosyltransferase family A protein [Solirubrobacteraceae bacterium]
MSVVVPVHRGERFLGAALESVASQTCRVLETIVVIDGPTDASDQIASAAGARVLVRERGGVASARNAGVRAASGSLIAFLDQDDVWQPQKLGRQLERMRSLPPVDIVLCHMKAQLLPGTPRPEWLPSEWERAPQTAFIPSAWLVRKELFDEVGPFDEKLEIACDSDWLARAKDCGRATDMLADSLLLWRVHGSNASYDRVTMERELLGVLRRTAARQRQAAVR